MKTLHLTLKKKWFDMILSGEKKEEYREVKPYWIDRISTEFSHSHDADGEEFDFKPKDYDQISFRNGYQKDAPEMTVEFKSVEIGEAKPEWSDNWKGDVFVIKLGEIIETKNITRPYSKIGSNT